jgi:hypothetical protein
MRLAEGQYETSDLICKLSASCINFPFLFPRFEELACLPLTLTSKLYALSKHSFEPGDFLWKIRRTLIGIIGQFFLTIYFSVVHPKNVESTIMFNLKRPIHNKSAKSITSNLRLIERG